MEYDIQEILKILPHKQPFLFVDKAVVDEDTGVVTGTKCVSYNEPFFQGHFPDYPVMPGVLLMETLAQLGAIGILTRDEYRGSIPLFAGINKCRFKKPVRPGDVLEMQVEITRMRRQIGTGYGIAKVRGEVVCEGEFLFHIAKPEVTSA
ncbi:MAG: 3-hydroxyacyl-ACP dehydratase FabZ [Tissierellia bacterium]|jgi:3-hydroxyacyl-[acyl-carrier-protein] dehydratase|nr:3-hydroxyacyl-ACP dehydratase FabZ [Bacillota bacterium]NLK58658.1 3-hydroxyacyl-ACP dehydratase FabZ [Tissierellia bacterium]